LSALPSPLPQFIQANKWARLGGGADFFRDRGRMYPGQRGYLGVPLLHGADAGNEVNQSGPGSIGLLGYRIEEVQRFVRCGQDPFRQAQQPAGLHTVPQVLLQAREVGLEEARNDTTDVG